MNGTDWIMTYTGRHFTPFDPKIQDIDIRDIAHALSNICRFGGHCSEFYSVAEHSILVSILCPPELKLAGLLHDAAEAYLGDVPTPLKQNGFRDAEARLMDMIYRKYGCVKDMTLPYPWTDQIKTIDHYALLIEAESLGMKPWEWSGEEIDSWNKMEDPPFFLIQKLIPKQAERLFLTNYRILTNPQP